MSLSRRNQSIHPALLPPKSPPVSIQPPQVLAISIIGFGNCLYLIFQEDIEREDATGTESPIRTRYVRPAADETSASCVV